MSTDQEPIDTLGTALPREMARVRDKVMPAYAKLRGDAGSFALAQMIAWLDAAAKALAEGDAVAMIHAYQELKGFTT